MQFFKKSDDDVHGLIPYSLGVTLAVVAVTCVAGANVLNQVAQTGELPTLAVFSPKGVPSKPVNLAQGKPPRPAAVDYGTTASITAPGGSADNFLAHPVVLDPCTGTAK